MLVSPNSEVKTGSERDPRAGLGVAPKPSSYHLVWFPREKKVRRGFRRDAENNTRDACAPRETSHASHHRAAAFASSLPHDEHPVRTQKAFISASAASRFLIGRTKSFSCMTLARSRFQTKPGLCAGLLFFDTLVFDSRCFPHRSISARPSLRFDQCGKPFCSAQG